MGNENTQREPEAELDRLRQELAHLCDQSSNRIRILEGEVQALRLNLQQLSALYQDATKWKRALVLLPLAPVDWVTGSLMLGAEMVGRALGLVAPRRAPLFPPVKMECSFIIVSWNGKALLEESLPSLLKAVHRDGGNHEVIVVDNGSLDRTSEFVQRQFPSVRLVRSEQNLYFGGGNRLGIEKATRDILVFLNNDMIVDEGFLPPLMAPFRDPAVFGVASQVFLPSGKRREETGKTRLRFNGCDFDWSHDPISLVDQAQGHVPVFWLHGGAAAMDRRKFLWLGGFDDLYDPFYVEDADLSFRAWKAGWRCLLAVNSHVLHKHRSSTRLFGEDFVRVIVHRNQYLFFWKNVRDISLLLRHFLRAPRARVRHAGVVGMGIRREAQSYTEALRRLPAVLKRRVALARSTFRSDADILRLITEQSTYPTSGSPSANVPTAKPVTQSAAVLDAHHLAD